MYYSFIKKMLHSLLKIKYYIKGMTPPSANKYGVAVLFQVLQVKAHGYKLRSTFPAMLGFSGFTVTFISTTLSLAVVHPQQLSCKMTVVSFLSPKPHFGMFTKLL